MKFQRPASFYLRAGLFLGAFFGTLPLPTARAQTATSMSQVRRVFTRRSVGDAFFNRNLRAALQARGLKFTPNRQSADAFLDTSGNGLADGGFAGEMSFIGRGGKVLRREKVTRPAQSRVMAYRSLALKFRAVKSSK